MLAVAGGLLGAVTVAGAVTWGFSRMGPRTIPVIEPDARPLKIRPENPGGLVVPNQDQLVLEPPQARREAERRSGSARLDAGPEAPALDLLRQQAAPPTPPSVAPAPVPAPVPEPPPSSALPNAAPLAPPVAPPPAPVATVPSPSPAPAPAAVPQAAPPVTVPAATLRPVANGRAMVQLGALASEEAARAEWDRLTRRVPELAGFQPRIIRLDREGQAPLFRLRTSGLADGAAARALCEAVRAKGGACVPLGG
jgi:hypothetical protein